MKIWNKNICLTNRICILVISGALFSTLLLANVWPDEVEPVEDGVEVGDEEECWIPTKEDIPIDIIAEDRKTLSLLDLIEPKLSSIN